MPSIDAYLRAIKAKESTNNYSVLGPTHPKYGRALGAYQVMESNLPSWSQAAVGRQVTPDEFLKNPEIQDQIARHRFSQYAEKHGLDNAASMWHSGVPLAQAQARKDVLGTRTPDYVRDIARRAGSDTGGSTDGVQVAQPNPQADLPADGAAEAGGPPAQPGFFEGGPGALFGMPQKDWNAGDAMLGVGAALMARDNPTGASALSALASKAKTAQAGKSVLRTDPNTGIGVIFDPNTGATQTRQLYTPPKKEDLPSPTTMKEFTKNQEAVNSHANIANKMDYYRRLIIEDKVDIGFLEGAEKSWDELRGKALTDRQLNALAMARDFQIMADESLKANNGVQTEGDAQRALALFKPGGVTGMNPSGVLEYLDRGFKDASRRYGEAAMANDPYYRRYGDKVGPVDWDKGVAGNRTKFEESDKTFTPMKETYLKTKRAEQDQKATSVNGRPTSVKAPAAGGSFYDHMKK